MSKNIKSADELIQLLKNRDTEAFNSLRLENKNDYLDLTEIDLRGCEIHKANLCNANLSGSDFSECDIADVDFSNSDLTSIDLSGSNLKRVNFSNAIILGSRFQGANIINSDFAEADLSGADLSEADLSGSDLSLSINLSECIFDKYTIWPDDDKLPDGFDSEYVEDLSRIDPDDDCIDLSNEDYAY